MVVEKEPKIHEYRRSKTTGSQECLSLARHWLDKCLTTHSNSKPIQPEVNLDWRPSRLIHVGENNGDVIRLREHHDIPLCIRYTTLCHSWGE